MNKVPFWFAQYIYKEVILNHLRVKGSDALFDARVLADRSQFKEAQEILDNLINEVKSSGYSSTETML